MTPLSLTVRHYERETALSFISRLAKRNGLSYVQNFCADMGLKWMDVTRGSPEALLAISKLASVDPDRLIECAVRKLDGRRYSINGQVLSHGTLYRRTLRYCPLCLEQDQRLNGSLGRFGRIEWQLMSFRACPLHSTLLMTLPKVENGISPHDFWRRIDECWDGEIRKAVDAPQCITLATDFENYLIRRIVGTSDSSWLDQLELDLVCRLCEGLGIALTYGSKTFAGNLTPMELANATAAGFEAAKAGKRGLHAAFEAIKLASPGTVKGYLSDFGALSRWFRTIDAVDPRFASIIDEFTKFVFQNYALDDGQKVLGRTCPERRMHSQLSAANTVGLTKDRVAKFIRAMKIGDRNHDGNISLDAGKDIPLLQQFAGCITCSEVKRRLGVSFEMLDRLSKSGLLKPRFDLPELYPVYHPDDVAEFEESVFSRAIEMEETPRSYLPLNILPIHTQHKIEEVIRLVQHDELTTLCSKSGIKGLWSLYADPKEVRNQLNIDRPDGFTKEQLKSLLGLTFPTTNRLIQVGSLNATSVRHSVGGYRFTLVSKKALQAFLEKYVTLGLLVRDRQSQALRVRAELKKLGVDPLELGKNCSRIYLRSDIESSGYPFKTADQHYSEVVSRQNRLQAAEKTSLPIALSPSKGACLELVQ